MKCANNRSAGKVSVAIAIAVFTGMATSSVSSADVNSPPSHGYSIDASDPELLFWAQADATPVETPVSFTSEQAERGEERYQKECEDCHGGDLRGGMNGGAPLRGLAFEEKYASGMPASAMFGYMSQTMPPNAPGRYSPSIYADLMAYILSRNGFQPGAPLPSDIEALDRLIVEK